MKTPLHFRLSPDEWLIQENGWNKESQNAAESQFALGNGFLGLRGILEEVPHNARPGTYIAGLYDNTNAQETELVNLPNPIHFKMTVRGEKLGAVAMDYAKHKRFLDMKQGLLVRHTLYQDSRKRNYDYQSVRFVSMKDKNFIVMRVWLTPLDSNVEITVRTDTDVSTKNAGVLTEGWKQHYQVTKVTQSRKYDYVCVKTLEKEILVAYLSYLTYTMGNKPLETSDHAFHLRLRKGQTVCFTRIVCVLSSPEQLEGPLARKIRKKLDWGIQQGFDGLLKRHKSMMKRLWQCSDIRIKGDLEIQRAIRFNIHHMLICAPQDGGNSSVGAKTLSGEGYRCHVFWDTEIFLLPFYIFTQPDVAKNMLLYRYYRLDAARKNARKNGYHGAQFPWESADRGQECTPSWAKNYDGKIIAVKTGELEHHIVADIAYAVYNYFQVTSDSDFMFEYGCEILFETARFWASRVKLNKKTRRYEIRNVIGPDEFHEHVHDNAYTNMMAKWNLLAANRLYFRFKRENPAWLETLARNIRLEKEEVLTWKQIASRINIHVRKDGIIEQFRGYFTRKSVRITARDEFGMPDFPVGLDISFINKTQFVKQADVVMLLCLLPTISSQRVKKRNYFYYMNRTLHKSSLSPSAHAFLASEIGEIDEAYRLFQIALYMDLRNIYRNVDAGVHAACIGGAWQAAVNGFGGLRIEQNRLCFKPKLPASWKELAFAVQWRGWVLHFRIDQKKMKVYVKAKKKTLVPLKVNNKVYELRENKWRTITYG